MRVRCAGCEVRSAKVITGAMLLAGKEPEVICEYLTESFGVRYFILAGVTGAGIRTYPSICRDNSASPMNPTHVWTLKNG